MSIDGQTDGRRIYRRKDEYSDMVKTIYPQPNNYIMRGMIIDEVLQLLFRIMGLKITVLKLLPHLPGASEFMNNQMEKI